MVVKLLCPLKFYIVFFSVKFLPVFSQFYSSTLNVDDIHLVVNNFDQNDVSSIVNSNSERELPTSVKNVRWLRPVSTIWRGCLIIRRIT